MNVKKTLVKGTNRILTGLLSMLGFAALGFSACAYGSPHADFTVRGTVVNKANEAPIPEIRVGFAPTVWDEDAFGPQPEYGWRPNIYVFSNERGEFRLTRGDFPIRNKVLPVFVEDVEGLFQSEMFKVSFENVRPVGGDRNWYAGEYIVTTTFHLTKVKVE